MNLTGILKWVFDNVVKRVMALFDKKYPQYDKISDYVEHASEFALDLVIAAQASGKDNESKKAEAVNELIRLMGDAGVGDGKRFDLPGDLERQIASTVVEAALEAVKKKLGK